MLDISRLLGRRVKLDHIAGFKGQVGVIVSGHLNKQHWPLFLVETPIGTLIEIGYTNIQFVQQPTSLAEQS